MGLFDFLRPAPAALHLPRPGDLEAIADAARAAQDHEVQRRAQAIADANTYWQTGPIGNPNTGLLQSQDALVGTTPQPYVYLSDFMLAQLYADPVCRRACGEIASTIAAAGHVVSVPEGDDFLTDTYGLSDALGDAHKRANHLRAAGVLIDVEEEGDPPLSEPMDPARVRRIKGLVVFGGLSLQVIDWQGSDDEWVPPLWRPFCKVGQPRMFMVNATYRVGGYNKPIHWTRILYMQGVPLPPDVDGMLASPSTHYSLSLPDIIWAALRRYTTTTTNAERIAGSQGVWVFTVPNYAALQAAASQNPSGGGLFAQVASWVAQMLSNFNARKAMVGAPGFDIDSKTTDLAGWEQMEAGAQVQVANVSRVPVQKLFITPAVGLSATPSDQWKPQYDDACRCDFDEKWAPNEVRFYTLVYYLRTGRAPVRLSVRPGPWEEPTEEQRMTLHERGAAELKTLIEAGVITPAEARARYVPQFTVDFPLARDPVAKTTQATPETTAMPDVQAAALNGAQTLAIETSGILPAYRAGSMTREGVIALLRVANPAADPALLEAIVDGQVIGAPPAPLPAAIPSADANPTDTLLALEQDPEPLQPLIRRVAALVPGLRPEPWPHVTLLYLGALPSGVVGAVGRAAYDFRNTWPADLEPDSVGPLGDDGAVVLFLRQRGLGGAQNRLLRAMAPWVRAEQFPRFVPHITLGYAPGLTNEQVEALVSVTVPASVKAGPMVLRRGGGNLTTWARS